MDCRFVAVEPASCPSLTRGKYVYDYCDTGMICPLAKMYTLGSGFIPSASHAGGLRYHGMNPTLSELYDQGLMEAVSVEQTSVFAAAEYFARVEGILPAPESSHAIKVALDEALKCKETGEEKTIVFGLTGTGYFDMFAYERFNNGEMSDYIPTDEELENYNYRSKKEIKGQVRLTKIGDVDLCACCGTHVALTGEIGPIKAVSMMNYKSGVRITLQVGRKAFADYCEKNASVYAISALLCAKTEEVADAVEKLQMRLKDADFRYQALKKELFAEKIKAVSGERYCMFDDGASADDARILADMLADKVGIAAVFSGNDEEGYKYAVVSRESDVREIGKSLNSALNGRGGGKPNMIQGSVAASKAEIESFWATV